MADALLRLNDPVITQPRQVAGDGTRVERKVACDLVDADGGEESPVVVGNGVEREVFQDHPSDRADRPFGRAA